MDFRIGRADAGVVENAAFFKRRAGTSRPGDMVPFLENARDEPPAPGDER